MSPPSLDAEATALTFDDVSVVRGGRLIWSKSTFKVPSGGILAVIGSNGSGKTTLLHVIARTDTGDLWKRPCVRQTPGRR